MLGSGRADCSVDAFGYNVGTIPRSAQRLYGLSQTTLKTDRVSKRAVKAFVTPMVALLSRFVENGGDTAWLKSIPKSRD